MKAKSRSSEKKSTRILRGILVCTATTILSAVLFTFLTLSEKINIQSMGYVYPVIAVSMMLGGLCAAWKVTEKIGIIIGATAGGYALILFATAILVFDGLGISALFGLLSIALGTGLSCAICIRQGSHKKIRKRVSV